MPKPILGVPFHPKYVNEAFEQTIETLKKNYHFEIQLLNWQQLNEDNVQQTTSAYEAKMDGLLIPGGHYGTDFKLFGSDSADSNLEILFKLSLFKSAMNKGMPILGLCAGNCFINAALGGTLELLTKKNGSSNVNHDIDPRGGDLAHSISIAPNTHLHDILRGPQNKTMHLQVNSWHHAANKRIANPFTVSAVAPDGVVEAIEMRYPGNPNCWGLQFHPEYVDAKKNPLEYKLQSRILNAFWTATLQFQHKRDVLKDMKNFPFFSKRIQKSEEVRAVTVQSKL